MESQAVLNTRPGFATEELTAAQQFYERLTDQRADFESVLFQKKVLAPS